MPEFVLTSPDGNEHRTSSAVLRSRLLSQGYKESKGEAAPQQAPAQSPRPQPRTARTQTQTPAPVVQDAPAES